MTLLFALAVVVIVALVGSLPIWPHSKNWGYYPIVVSAVVLIILILFLTGRLRGL
jgi:hypothetical protein